MNRLELTLLIVDDDDVVAESIERTLTQTGLQATIVSARNGHEAIRLLRGEGQTKPLPKSTVVLLDLNMPVMDGHQFLSALRDDEELRSTVVFVVSTSELAADRSRAYEKCIAGYIVRGRSRNTTRLISSLIEQYDAAITF